MENIAILCIDDEREVLDAITRDLEYFASSFRIEPCESAEDARSVIEELEEDGIKVGLILADHMMPGESGVDFLVSLSSNANGWYAKKILVTAQAGLEDTVKALNRANLDHYIRKPWDPKNLKEVVTKYLTQFVIEQTSDPLAYMSVLDAEKILKFYANQTGYRPS